MKNNERIKLLEITVQQLGQQLSQQLQETRNLLEGLAAVSDLEYSLDARKWVSKEKLKALRESNG
jgi:hypothetical protein